MKRIVSGALLLLTLMTACRKEAEAPSPERYASFRASIGCETRSQASLAVEDFHKAMCFAFGTDGKILVYGPEAGPLQGKPVVCYTEDRDFSWDLPLGVPMDLWCMVNYGTLDMSSCLSNTALTTSYLEGLTFTSASPAALKALESNGQGLPMAGKQLNVTLNGADDALSIRVKYLFAKYQLRFSSSNLLEAGWEIVAQDISVQNASTSVYWFREGVAPEGCTYRSYDAANSAELAGVNLCRPENTVTLYMLENCQGDKGPAGSWRTVRQDIGESALSRCTYIQVRVVVQKSGEGRMTREYRIYLGRGSDMKANFDVCRNVFRSIGLNLEHPSDAFEFTGGHSLSVLPGESLLIPYETTLEEADISLSGITGWTHSWSATNTAWTTAYPHSGHFAVDIPGNASAGTVYKLTGGSSTVNDAVTLTVRNPLELSVRWTAEASYVGYDCRFSVEGLESGESLSSVSALSGVYVSAINGADVSFAPGKTSQTIRVVTSRGRTLDIPVTATLPELTGPSLLSLSLDGTSGNWSVGYVSGGTSLTGFNPTFYSRYLQPSKMTLTPVNSTYARLFQAVNTGGANYSASTWDISGGCPYSTVLAHVKVSPVNFSLIPGVETGLQVKPAYSGSSTLFAYVDDYSLIPANGAISTGYLQGQGLTYGSQSVRFTLDESALGVNPERITGVESDAAALTDVQRDGPRSFSFQVSSAGQPGNANIFFVVTHPASGISCRVCVGRVTVRLHLAVGGVRTALKWSGNQASFTGQAVFASIYQGGESTRYSDWPEVAVRLKDSFKTGASREKCVAYATNSGVLEQEGGVAWAYADVDDTHFGTGITLYTIRYTNNGSSSARINSHYQNFTPYQRLYNLQSGGELGGSAVRLVFGNLQVHSYANLYPASKGWLTPGSDCEKILGY